MQGGQVVVDAEARQLLAREDDRLAGRRQERGGLGEGLGEGGLVRHLGLVADGDGLDAAVDQVARQLQVDRPLGAAGRLPASGRWSRWALSASVTMAAAQVTSRKISSWLSKLRILWWRSGSRTPLRHPRATADDDDGRLLGEGLGRRVDDLEPAHAVGHAERADAVHPRIGVRGEAGALLVGRVDERELRLLEAVVEAQHVVARDPEDMSHAERDEPVDQIAPHRRRHRAVLPSLHPPARLLPHLAMTLDERPLAPRPDTRPWSSRLAMGE